MSGERWARTTVYVGAPSSQFVPIRYSFVFLCHGSLHGLNFCASFACVWLIVSNESAFSFGTRQNPQNGNKLLVNCIFWYSRRFYPWSKHKIGESDCHNGAPKTMLFQHSSTAAEPTFSAFFGPLITIHNEIHEAWALSTKSVSQQFNVNSIQVNSIPNGFGEHRNFEMMEIDNWDSIAIVIISVIDAMFLAHSCTSSSIPLRICSHSFIHSSSERPE